jgi:hypothetical protein
LFVSLLFYEQGSSVIAVSGLQDADTEFRAAAIGSRVFYYEVPYAIGGEEIADDHFCLDLAVGIAFVWKGDIDPAIEVAGQIACVPDTDGCGDVIKRIQGQRAERNQDERKSEHRQPYYAFHVK